MLTDPRVLLLGPILLCLVSFRRIQRVKQAWHALGSVPAYSIFVSPISIYGRFLPRIPWISAGVDFTWRDAYERQPLSGSTVFLSN